MAVGVRIVLATGNTKFLKFAPQLLKSTVIVALQTFSLITLDRPTALAQSAFADLVSGNRRNGKFQF